MSVKQPSGDIRPSRAEFGSDLVVDLLRDLGYRYLPMNPGSSFRGLHDSVVNHGGNTAPQLLLCLHEEIAVSIAHGYAKATGLPAVAAVHDLAGLYAVIGALLGLLERSGEVLGDGQPAEIVDVALYEAVYSLLDSVVAEYDAFGVIRERTGSTIAGVAPSNAYRCADGTYVVIGANADAVFARLAEAMGQPELACDPRYAGAAARWQASEELDELVGAWGGAREEGEVMAALQAAGVPATPIYDAADIAADARFATRGAHERYEVPVADERGTDGTAEVRFPAPIPQLARLPACSGWAGPELGEHTREVLTGIAGLNEETLDRLAAEGVI